MRDVQKAATEDPVETLMERVRKEPLMMLKRSYVSGCEMDIVTRHGTGIRGVIRATHLGNSKNSYGLEASV